jgi:hypothetical protein
MPLRASPLSIALLLHVSLQLWLSSSSSSSSSSAGSTQSQPATVRAAPNLTNTTIQYLGFWGPDQPENMSSFSACHYALVFALTRAGTRAPHSCTPTPRSSMQQI